MSMNRDSDAFLSDGLPFPLRGRNDAPQLEGQSFAGHLEQVEAGRSGSRLDVRIRLAGEVDDLPLIVDDDARGRVLVRVDAW